MKFPRKPPFLILRAKATSVAARQMTPGAGVVGVPQGEALLVYFEGNRFYPSHLGTWEERVQHAADLMARAYPSVTCGLYPPSDFDVIGRIDHNGEKWTMQLDP